MTAEDILPRERTSTTTQRPVNTEQYLNVQLATAPVKNFQTTSEISRQTLVDTSNDDVYSIKNLEGSRNPISPSVSNVGFQSIFHTVDHPRSKVSVASNHSLRSNDNASAATSKSGSSQIGNLIALTRWSARTIYLKSYLLMQYPLLRKVYTPRPPAGI